MASNDPWPTPCFVKLLDLLEQNPRPSGTQIAIIINAMPESKAAGFSVTKSAVGGKAFRWARRAGGPGLINRIPTASADLAK